MARPKQIQNYSTPTLEQVGGSNAGQLYELNAQLLSIGRSDDNDIVLVSEAVSRRHAEIERSSDGRVWIRDNGSKNGIQVNGDSITERELTNGDVVQVGNFVFRYTDPAVSAVPTSGPGEVAEWNESGLPNAKPKKAPNRRVLIYAVVGLAIAAAVYISQQEDKPKDDKAQETTIAPEKPKTATGIETENSKEPSTEAPSLNTASPAPKVMTLNDPTLSRAEQDLQRFDMNNTPLKGAEQYFRRGLREYQNKNYNRAIEDFQAALSLYREHPLANDYLRLVVYEAESEAKRNMEIGVKYFDSLQYGRAIYHFNQVVDLMQHRPSDPVVGRALKYIESCKKRLQASELFP